MFVVVGSAQGQGGVIAESFVQDAVKDLFVAIHVVAEGVVAFQGADDSAAQAVFFVRVPEKSPLVRTLPKRSTCPSMLRRLSAVGRLRMTLMLPPGSLAAFFRPVAPRTTSMRSYNERSFSCF